MTGKRTFSYGLWIRRDLQAIESPRRRLASAAVIRRPIGNPKTNVYVRCLPQAMGIWRPKVLFADKAVFVARGTSGINVEGRPSLCSAWCTGGGCKPRSCACRPPPRNSTRFHQRAAWQPRQRSSPPLIDGTENMAAAKNGRIARSGRPSHGQAALDRSGDFAGGERPADDLGNTRGDQCVSADRPDRRRC